MELSTRKMLDRSFTGLGLFSILLMGAALLVLLVPITWKGVRAFIFQETVEHRQFVLDHFGRGDADAVEAEVAETERAREPVWQAADAFRALLPSLDADAMVALEGDLIQPVREIKASYAVSVLAPEPGSDEERDARETLLKSIRTFHELFPGVYADRMAAFEQRVADADASLKEVSGELAEVLASAPKIIRQGDRETLLGLPVFPRQREKLLRQRTTRAAEAVFALTLDEPTAETGDATPAGAETAEVDEATEILSRLIRQAPQDLQNRAAEALRTFHEAMATLREAEQANRDVRRARQRVSETKASLDRAMSALADAVLPGVPEDLLREEAVTASHALLAENFEALAGKGGHGGLLHKLLGPRPGEELPVMPRDQYGATRWERCEETIHKILTYVEYDRSDPTKMGERVERSRRAIFEGTPMAAGLEAIASDTASMMNPKWIFYGRFLIDEPVDANMFGGIWPAFIGTFYLTIGAMLFAVPAGVITAIYLAEYAPSESRMVSVLRIFISTLAGVPSIVFGLFGLAFFINWLWQKDFFHEALSISQTKNVLTGSLVLALLILPTVIRASEEAIRSVPRAYKEAAAGLGATRWHTVTTVTLPAALPGILTGVIISMGRAAGETAPIIFTAAVSVGSALQPCLYQFLQEPTQALPWNIYNLATEHEAVDEIRHVQYGMVLVLVGLVLLLNVTAILLRARISKKLRG